MDIMDFRYRGSKSKPLVTGSLFLQAIGKVKQKPNSDFVVIYLDRRLSGYIKENVKFQLAGALGPGAPALVMQMELLIAQGFSNFLLVGTAGILDSKFRVGEIVVATESLIDEGTSPHYGFQPGSFMSSSKSLLDSFPDSWPRAKTWTTDAPFREFPEEVKHYQELGISIVEMESSAAFSVGKIYGVNVASVMVLSDEIHQSNWKSGLLSPALLEGFSTLGQYLSEGECNIFKT
jgi:hypothetical protein